jgi:hypothetical protein
VEAFCFTPVIVLSLLRGWCVVYVGDAISVSISASVSISVSVSISSI